MWLMLHKYIDMEYNKFENHIANVLRQDQAEMDIDSFINDLHKKRSRRFPVWIWISGLMVIVFIGSGLLITKKLNSKNNVITSAKKDNTPENGLNHHLSAVKNEHPSSSELMLSSSEKSNISEIKTKKGAQSMKNTENKNLSSFYSSVKNNRLKDFASLNQKANSKSENIIISEKQNFKATNSIVKPAEYQQVTTKNRHQISVSSLDYSPANLSTSMLGKIKTGNVVCPTFHKKGRFAVDIIPEIGYFRPFKKLEYEGNEPNNIYTLRNQNESTLEGLNAGIYFRLSNDKLPVFFQAGTSFSRMTEKMPLDYAYTKRDTTRGIISITQSQSGDTVTVIYGDIIQENKISGRKTSHHHFTMIDLPLSVGFEKSFGDWSGGLEGGVVINLALKAGGQILASDTSFTAIDQPVEAYKNRLGISYFGGLFVTRNFNRFGKFYIALRARYIPDSFSSDYNRIRQSYHILGLNAGYIYSF
jgi:hypothetical protein